MEDNKQTVSHAKHARDDATPAGQPHSPHLSTKMKFHEEADIMPDVGFSQTSSRLEEHHVPPSHAKDDGGVKAGSQLNSDHLRRSSRHTSNDSRGPKQSAAQLGYDETGSRTHEKSKRRKIHESEAEFETMNSLELTLAKKDAELVDLRDRLSTAGREITELHSRLAEEQKQRHALKVDLGKMKDHISGLQSGLKEITPKEVAADYDNLVAGVSKWVENFLQPVLESPHRCQSILSSAKRGSLNIEDLQKFVANHTDIRQGMRYPETDVDTVIAIVMSYLTENIFEKPLIGCQGTISTFFHLIEDSMEKQVVPTQDLYARRTWFAQAYNAFICTTAYKEQHNESATTLTAGLTKILGAFWEQEAAQMYPSSCLAHCILPALQLHEKLVTSIHQFHIEVIPYLDWMESHQLVQSPEFFDDVEDLQLEDLLDNRRTFKVPKMDQRAKLEMQRHLRSVMVVVPGIWMQRVGRGNDLNEPVVIRKQHMLVTYGTREQRARLRDGEQSLLFRLYNTKRERRRWTGFLTS